MDEILVIDVGGTKTSVSIVELDSSKIKILSTDVLKTHSNPEHTIQEICSIYHSKQKRLDQMSLSLPGRWDEKGVLKESFFLHGWLEYPFVVNLSDRLGVKSYIWETDVICGALGEYNACIDTFCDRSLLYINLGTGIAAALIKDGKPYKSDSKLTLRMQKLVFPFQEELFSGVDLISGGLLLQASKYTSVESLYYDYKRGEVEAFDIISRAQTQLSAWIINLFYLFAPDVIVLNGGLTYDWEVLAEEAVEIANEELAGQVDILPSRLKELAPIYGAYLNLKQVVSLRGA